MLTGPIGSMLVMTGHERWSMAYALVALVLTAILSASVIPAFGLTGAAIVSASILAFRNLIALFLVSRLIGLRHSNN